MNLKTILSNFMHKRSFRWYLLAGVSLLANLAFAVYNFIVGVLFRLVWNFSVSFYYLALLLVKAVILYREQKWRSYPAPQIQEKRLALFRLESVFLLLVDFALIAPIVLLVLQKKNSADIGMIPAIAVAAYTTYRIVLACINYSRSKKSDNLTLYGLKMIHLKEAIVSIITLQNTLIAVFGNASDMAVLTAWTSVGMFLSSLALSIFQFFFLQKWKKR